MEINGGFDRISLDRFDGSTGYYLYDSRGSVSGITNEEGQIYQSYRYSATGEITFGAPQYENEYTYNGESYNPNIESQYLRARYYCVVTATFLTEDSYLGSLTEPLTLNRYNYCVSSYLNYTDPSGNEVEVLESLKGWIIDPDTQAQKTIENYENQRLSIEDAIESGLLNNRAGQIFLDYGDVIMGPPVTLPSSLVGIREAIKGNSDSEEMQRTATAGFYAGFVGQGLEYVQIISKADYQLSLLIVTQKGLNAAANPLTYVEYFRNFSPQEKLEAAKRTAKGAWNGEYDSALGRKTGAAILDYLLVAIGGALMKGENAACEVAESGSTSLIDIDAIRSKLKTEPDTAFFWSGRTDGIGGAENAANIAKSRGGVTLESTIETQNIVMPEWNFNNPSTMEAWDLASGAYAEQVSGEIRAVIGSELRPGNIWENVELPRLKNNPNVTKITTIDPKTGVENVIFER